MNSTLRACLVLSMAVAAASGFAASAMAQKMHTPKSSSSDSPIDPKQPTGRSALRQTVQEQCVLHWQEQHHNPAPCERVVLADPKDGASGYAVIAAPGGGAHYLLVPTRTMVGIESSELLDPDAPNYFAEAWRARSLIGTFVGHEVPRTVVGLAIGMGASRVQDEFHIHIECLQPDAFKALGASAGNFTDRWSPITIAGSTYQALGVMADSLDASNVFELLATLSPDARHHMGNYTLVVAGMQFKGGPGFVLLTGTGPSGEILLDSSCAAAGL